MITPVADITTAAPEARGTDVPAMLIAAEMEYIETVAIRDIMPSDGQPGPDSPFSLQVQGGGFVSLTPGTDVLALNRVLGVGTDEQVSEQAIDRIIELFRDNGTPRFFIQINPSTRPAEIYEWLHKRGFRHYNNWVKLYRGTDPPPVVETKLQVREIGHEYADIFAAIFTEAIGWPEKMRPYIASLMGREEWHHYMAFDDNEPVGTAAFRVVGDCAWLGYAATRPEYRKMGAQHALIHRRILDATSLGCRHLVMETAEDRPDHPAPSFRNNIRMGFRVAYLRSNYLLELNRTA